MKKIVVSILTVVLLISFAYAFCPRPEIGKFTTYSRAYFAEDGSLLRITLADDGQYRIFESAKNISEELIAATILYEDQNYYDHFGVDFLALVRAFWMTYVVQQRRIGASTITMQVARMCWDIPSKTIMGKVEQIFRAIQLARHYSKDEIIELYVNLAPYGRNIEGIAAASLIYFNKKPIELSLPEVLTLAVIPQNPNKRNPTTTKGFAYLSRARLNLLERWIEYHPDDGHKKKYFDLSLDIRPPEGLPFSSPHFIDYVDQKISRWQAGYVQTTLDNKLQAVMEQIVTNYVSSKNSLGIRNAAALLIDHRTMEIKSMIGSADFNDSGLHGQVNGVVAKRSPGSALKPFVYALALEEGLVHPMTLLKDSPRKFGGFTPENYDKRFLGPVLTKDALIQSRNVPAVELQSRLKKRSFHSFLEEADISELKDEAHYGLALALGGGEVTMMELATLYGALANKGELRDVRSFKEQKIKHSKKLLSEEAAFLTLDMLKENPQPGDIKFHAAATSKNDVAWKTGTSWAFRDAWAVGVSGPYILAVWVGNFDGAGNGAFIGRTAAGPLFFSILDAVFPDEGWRVESLANVDKLNLKEVEVCSKTGDLEINHCPQTATSWFIPGVSPLARSNIYRAIPIEKSTGLRACWFDRANTSMEVFEFWPSDFQQIYRQAGISLKTPPKFADSCSMDQKSSMGKAPVITSPQTTIEYVIRSDDTESKNIPFSAIVDPDVEKIHWFVDGAYEGISDKEQPFIWQASSGDFTVSAVDDGGRATTLKMRVMQLH